MCCSLTFAQHMVALVRVYLFQVGGCYGNRIREAWRAYIFTTFASSTFVNVMQVRIQTALLHDRSATEHLPNGHRLDQSDAQRDPNTCGFSCRFKVQPIGARIRSPPAISEVQTPAAKGTNTTTAHEIASRRAACAQHSHNPHALARKKI